MDADVKSAKPGKCPKCGMALREAQPGATGDEVGLQLRIPDITVYDQDGRRLRFYTDLIEGKTVAINFLFTTCTTVCPPLAATFRKVQQELGDRAGKDINLISISVDPSTDVPERLKQFAAKFKAGPGWSFITGSKSEMEALLRSLGAYTADKNDHTPMILVGNDRAGYWTRTYGLAPPATVMKVIDEAAGKSGGEPDSAVNLPSPRAEVRQKPKTPEEAAAAYFPNLTLLTQDNKPVRFFDDLLKGRIVMINFAFTTCTGICPPMTANLVKVQEYLGDRVGKDINMITISVDPIIDTPAELKKYANSFKVKPGWYFLTGKKEDVDKVLRKVGGYVEDKMQHSGILIVGNVGTGEWLKIFAMAKPDEITDAVLKLIERKDHQ
jgi:cytochrome oxidase Cu insertion factor (SCO1/SenC/PrrC family)